ncbi:hypothetical protein QFZ79_003142 [Arthrobacter sp. V4I6]|nr:hypothetical protein [Arthrobacter sp. V1I7]MDQ0855031.1 hypothetical protein [Arthrobacter sp. V4I6]
MTGVSPECSQTLWGLAEVDGAGSAGPSVAGYAVVQSHAGRSWAIRYAICLKRAQVFAQCECPRLLGP